MTGFGWNFYGFFIGALVWLAGYFLWAWAVGRGDRRGEP
jgi:hypothetical protein